MTSVEASSRRGTVATVAVGEAAVVSALAALTARRLWLGPALAVGLAVAVRRRATR